MESLSESTNERALLINILNAMVSIIMTGKHDLETAETLSYDFMRQFQNK